jgi:hypothetical protein
MHFIVASIPLCAAERPKRAGIDTAAISFSGFVTAVFPV